MPNVDEAVDVLAELPAKLDLWVVVRVALIVLAALVVSKIVMSLVGRMLKRSKLDPSLIRILRSVVKFVVGVVCILIICDTLGVEITSLIALFSVVGLALSLAVQSVLSNLAGGITVLGAKPFQTGDFVEIDGVTGKVKEISLLYTKLDTADNKLVYLPNKTVSETKVINFTGEATRRIELTFSVSYDSPIDRVKEAVLAMVAAEPLALDEPAPVVGVASYGASAINYNLWVWCAGADYWDAFYAVNEGVKKALDAAGLEMTYDHLNVHVIDQVKQA